MSEPPQSGERFGMLTVIGSTPRAGGRRWICLCDCGVVKELRPGNLRSGETKSCGCRPRFGKSRFQELIESVITRGMSDECLQWMYSKNSSGYGTINIGRSPRLITRLVYEVFIDYIPKDRKYVVCHRCDNPPCYNPNHLFLGTYSDNLVDAISKGRKRPINAYRHLRVYKRNVQTSTMPSEQKQ